MPDPGSSDKAECEIEITPEMIEAGLMHLYRYHPDTGVGDKETVVRIFVAMKSLCPRIPSAGQQAGPQFPCETP